jgi:hypothetical protein
MPEQKTALSLPDKRPSDNFLGRRFATEARGIGVSTKFVRFMIRDNTLFFKIL